MVPKLGVVKSFILSYELLFDFEYALTLYLSVSIYEWSFISGVEFSSVHVVRFSFFRSY